jgi:hypothetical protein
VYATKRNEFIIIIINCMKKKVPFYIYTDEIIIIIETILNKTKQKMLLLYCNMYYTKKRMKEK